MPLSNKHRADYAKLINEQLDNIQINSSKDFDAIVIGLSYIIYPKENYIHIIGKDLQKTVANIAKYLDKTNATSIMCYVEERYYPEYLEIIKKSIKKKITEFEKMSKEEREKYIDEQQKRKSQAKRNQAEFEKRKSPEAHAIDEQQWLAKEQARFQEECSINNLSNEDRAILNILLDLSNHNSIRYAGYSNRGYMLYFIEILHNNNINSSIALSFIKGLNDNKRLVLAEYPSAFAKLISHVTLEEFARLEFDKFKALFDKHYSFINSGITVTEILSVPLEQQFKFISHIEELKYLVDNGITLNYLSGIESSAIRNYVLKNPKIFVELISVGVSLEDLPKISCEKLEILSGDYFGNHYSSVAPNILMNEISSDYEHWRYLSVQGFSRGHFMTGICYELGKGVKKDFDRAIEYYKLAAEEGFVPAQFKLGACYNFGIGIRRDFKEALKYYKLAAAQGITKNFGNAVKYHELESAKGAMQAQFSLGVHYEYGLAVDKDFGKAVKYYRSAAEQGHACAKRELAILGNSEENKKRKEENKNIKFRKIKI